MKNILGLKWAEMGKRTAEAEERYLQMLRQRNGIGNSGSVRILLGLQPKENVGKQQEMSKLSEQGPIPVLNRDFILQDMRTN